MFSLIPRLLCVGEEEPGTHALFAPPGILSVTLTSTRHANFSHVRNACHCMLCMDDDEVAIKAINSSLTEIIHTFIHSS